MLIKDMRRIVERTLLKTQIQKIGTPVGTQYAATAVSAIAGFLFMYILTSKGSLEIYGQYLALISASSLLNNLIGMRTNEAVIRFAKEAWVTGEISRKSEVLILGLLIDLIIASLLYGVFAVFANVIAVNLLKNPALEETVYAYGVYVFIVASSGTINGYLIAANKIIEHAFLQIVMNVAKIIGLLAVISFADVLSLHHVVNTLAVSSILLLTPLYVVVPVIFSGTFGGAIFRDRGFIFDFLSFSFKTFISGFLKAGNRKIDELSIATFADPQALGLYGLIKQFLVPTTFLTTPISTVWYPKFVEIVTIGGNHLLSLIHSINIKAVKFLVGVTLFLVLCNLLYLKYLGVNLDLMNTSIVFLSSGTALMQASQWWARPFSNAVNPMMSVEINFYATALSIFVLIPSVYFWGIFGAAVISFLIAMIVVFYWRYNLVSYSRHG